jgi:lipopolysaccharide export system protein LptA
MKAAAGFAAMGFFLLVVGACSKATLSPLPNTASKAVAPVPTAQPSPVLVYSQTRPMNQAKPVKVRSKALRVGRSGADTVFYGGVTVTQDSTTLTSLELLSRDQGRTALATGDVHLLDPVRRVGAQAQQVEYGNDLRQVSLRGDVHLRSIDPYGLGVTLTGDTATYEALSQAASVSGTVTIYRGGLTATAGSGEMLDGGAYVHLSGGVEADLGVNEARSREAELEAGGRSLILTGDVRARFIPSDVRKAAANPAGVQ